MPWVMTVDLDSGSLNQLQQERIIQTIQVLRNAALIKEFRYTRTSPGVYSYRWERVAGPVWQQTFTFDGDPAGPLMTWPNASFRPGQFEAHRHVRELMIELTGLYQVAQIRVVY